MKRTIRISLISVILFILCLGCIKITKTTTGAQEATMIKWIGKSIELPNGLPLLTKGVISRGDYLMLVYINGHSQSALKELNAWKSYLNNHQSTKTTCQFYIYHESKEFVSNYLKQIDFSYPVFFDHTDQFNKCNKLPDDQSFNALLVNNKNQVLVIGNPVRHEHIKSWYESYW